ncbi:uncharacterized protein BdWA1_004095 [Babesia duncani]|nr:hypothetical protein BdWA1_004095 [Babesia duncani]
MHFKLIWYALVELGYVKNVTANKYNDGNFLSMLVGHLPHISKIRNNNIYYDYNHDTIVLEGAMLKSSGSRIWDKLVIRPLSKIYRILNHAQWPSRTASNAAYSLESRAYLISCIENAIARSHLVSKNMTLCNAWFYFVVRYSYWYCHCHHLDVDLDELTDEELLHKMVFLHFFPSGDLETDSLVTQFMLKVPLGRLSSHAAFHHHGSPCDGDCSILRIESDDRRIKEVVESLLVESLFHVGFYDETAISLNEFYYALLSMNHINNAIIYRMFKAFKVYSTFLKNKQHYEVIHEAKILNDGIKQMKARIDSQGGSGAMVNQQYVISHQIENVKHEISEIEKAIDREQQVIMAARAAAAVALNLHLGIDKIVTEEITNEDILNAIKM